MERSDMFKVRPLPLRVAAASLPKPSPASSATSAFEDARLHSDEAPAAIDPFSARAIHSAHGCGFPCDPSAPSHRRCGADAACSCVPPDFRFNPHGRVRPEDDELSVHPVVGKPDRHGLTRKTRNGVLQQRHAGPVRTLERQRQPVRNRRRLSPVPPGRSLPDPEVERFASPSQPQRRSRLAATPCGVSEGGTGALCG